MVHRTRHGKRIIGRHTTLIEGLDEVLRRIEDWPEIGAVLVRWYSKSRKSSRSGGLDFRATRWEIIGPIKVGIRCIASAGSATQVVTLTSRDLDKLHERLVSEGLCDGID